MLEFLFDTTRVVVDLILNGTIASCPDMTLIVPHAGAALGVVADRVQAFGRLLAPEVDVLGDLRRLYYDLAGYAVPRQLAPLLALTTTSHLHYGSDFPWTPEPVVAAALELLSGVEGLVGELTTNSTSLFLSSM